MDHCPISPLPATVPCMLAKRDEKETLTIQDLEKRGGPHHGFRSALPEDLEWDTRIQDVALALDAIKRCLTNILVALDRNTPQMKGGLTLPPTCTAQELMMTHSEENKFSGPLDLIN